MTVKQSDIPSALILTRGNRLTGLLRDLEDALRTRKVHWRYGAQKSRCGPWWTWRAAVP